MGPVMIGIETVQWQIEHELERLSKEGFSIPHIKDNKYKLYNQQKRK